MASDGASGADRSDNNKSSDRSSKSERAESDVSEKSRDALSGGNTAAKERDLPPTPQERAAGQERMAAASRPAKERVEKNTHETLGRNSLAHLPTSKLCNPFNRRKM